MDTRDPEASRCAAHGSKGRCQLPGTIGHASASGGKWLCPWHHEVQEYSIFPSRENFEAFLAAREERGDLGWRARTHDAWWLLVQGAPGLGGWDYRSGQKEEALPAKMVPGYD